MKNAKTKRNDAEKAAEHLAIELLGAVITRRAVRSKFHAVDFFACDVVGKKKDGTHIYIQATAGGSQAVRFRQKKLENIPWHNTDIVLIAQLKQSKNPTIARQKNWFFKLFFLIEKVWFPKKDLVEIPKKWFVSKK